MLEKLLLTLFTTISFANYTPDVAEIEVVEEQKEIVEYNIPLLNAEDSIRTEEDIYKAAKTEFVEQTALKAVQVDYNGLTFYYLTDLQGSTYITNETLVHGKNYVGFVNIETKELISSMESTFVFSYEEDWQNDELLNDEIEYTFNELAISL